MNPMQKWASSDPGDDLHIEPGRPSFAKHADERATRAVENDYQLSKEQKDKALAKFKVGAKVRGNASAFKMKGKSGKITKMERTAAAAFVYTIALDGGGTERALESELQRA